MEFSSFTFILTEKCNFNCSYCYQQKGERYTPISEIERALDFFAPFFKSECYVNFTGGEPLLAFEELKRAVSFIQKKNSRTSKRIGFSLTTNGSLVDDNILQFLRRNEFDVMLSFDGHAQEQSRKEGSSEKIKSVMDKFLGIPEIGFTTNSVFIPSTVGFLSDSIQHLMEMGVSDINLSLSNFPAWDQESFLQLREELLSLRKFSLVHYKRNQRVPVSFLRKRHERGVFRCAAGKSRMALAPDGKLWGCYLFADYLRGREKSQEYNKYCFGSLDSFIKNHEEIYPEVFFNYSNLFMDIFSTPEKKCFFCHDVEDCVVCPVEVAFSSSAIGKIPHWTCQIRQLLRNENHAFWEELEGRITEMDSYGIEK